jgi:phospholipase C
VTRRDNPYAPVNMPALSDLFSMFDFDGDRDDDHDRGRGDDDHGNGHGDD